MADSQSQHFEGLPTPQFHFNSTNATQGPSAGSGADDGESLSRLKRTACIICRKRKLKCDGGRPKCQTCDRLGHDCKYDEVRKKSGPKRGYVKVLEARLAQVETQLKHNQNAPDIADDLAADAFIMDTSDIRPSFGPVPYSRNADNTVIEPASLRYQDGTTDNSVMQDFYNQNSLFSNVVKDPTISSEEPMSWDMISLGLEEPLPTAEVVDELNHIYFEKIHPSMPIMHRGRFYANMHLAPKMRPPVCLRYAMWTLAAGWSDAYSELVEHFYRRARKYLELDEMRGFGENMVSLAHCQTWIMMAIYEFKNMHFPRAWMSTGRAVRLAQALSLHRIDGAGLDVKQCLPAPKDWTEREERRRTFWMAFWEDRCASIGTGWPMTIEEQDIMTRLPASDEAFQNSKPESTLTLEEAMDSRTSELSGFAGAVLLSALFGRNLTHLHRPGPDDREEDLNGPFWERHRKLDNILLNINLTLPNHLRVPMGLPCPNIIFMNMCIHTSVICLHQAAIFKADKHRLPSNISGESKMRCLTAASEIAGIMRAIAHLDLSMMNPFMAFCLYVSSRVFVQVLKARRNDQQIRGSLDFLLRAMHVMKRKNPLTESFIAQLDLDMESAGLSNPTASFTNKIVGNPMAAGSLNKMSANGVPIYPRSCDGGPPRFRFPEDAPEGYHFGNITELKSGRLYGVGRNESNPSSASDQSPNVPSPDLLQQVRTESSASSEMSIPTHPRRNDEPLGDSGPKLRGILPTNIGAFGSRSADHDLMAGQDVMDVSPPILDVNGLDPLNSFQQSTNTWLDNHGDPADVIGFNFTRVVNHSMSSTAPRSNENFMNPKSPPGISEQEFNAIASQLFPPTPAADREASMKTPEAWDWTNIGATPSSLGNDGTDWNQILDGIPDWDGITRRSR